MRLQTRGSSYVMRYEQPRDVLRRAGVRRGTVLLDGNVSNGSFSGVARRFSRYCPGEPLEYRVSGRVYDDPYSIIVDGRYEVHDRCRPTGRLKGDQLVFTFIRNC
ncbi:hypothetical protein [Acuticoccus mangrovi]|nr:hypothetical protein [Acuticoccus mangrovi]